MAFFWNLETAVFTFSATATLVNGGSTWHTNATGTVGFGPPARSGDFTHPDYWSYTGAVAGTASGTTFADLGAVTTPKQRVCKGSIPLGLVFGSDIQHTGSDRSKPTLCNFRFCIVTDDLNTGKYAIEYSFSVTAGNFTSGSSDSARIAWKNPSASAGASVPTTLNSGTFTIGGHAFSYVCQGNTFFSPFSVTYSGGSMSATSSSFTY